MILKFFKNIFLTWKLVAPSIWDRTTQSCTLYLQGNDAFSLPQKLNTIQILVYTIGSALVFAVNAVSSHIDLKAPKEPNLRIDKPIPGRNSELMGVCPLGASVAWTTREIYSSETPRKSSEQ